MPARTNTYNPRVHITAGELRRLGYLSEMIPDEAYVRRAAVGYDPDTVLDDGTPTLRLCVLEQFIEPETADETFYALAI